MDYDLDLMVHICPRCRDGVGAPAACNEEGVCFQCGLHWKIPRDDPKRFPSNLVRRPMLMKLQMFSRENWDSPSSCLDSDNIEEVAMLLITWLRQWETPGLKLTNSRLYKKVNLITLEVEHVGS